MKKFEFWIVLLLVILLAGISKSYTKDDPKQAGGSRYEASYGLSR